MLLHQFAGGVALEDMPDPVVIISRKGLLMLICNGLMQLPGEFVAVAQDPHHFQDAGFGIDQKDDQWRAPAGMW